MCYISTYVSTLEKCTLLCADIYTWCACQNPRAHTSTFGACSVIRPCEVFVGQVCIEAYAVCVYYAAEARVWRTRCAALTCRALASTGALATSYQRCPWSCSSLCSRHCFQLAPAGRCGDIVIGDCPKTALLGRDSPVTLGSGRHISDLRHAQIRVALACTQRSCHRRVSSIPHVHTRGCPGRTRQKRVLVQTTRHSSRFKPSCCAYLRASQASFVHV